MAQCPLFCMKKISKEISARWMSRWFAAENKRNSMSCSETTKNPICRSFLQMKRHPRRQRVKSAGKVMVMGFRDAHGIIHTEFLQKY